MDTTKNQPKFDNLTKAFQSMRESLNRISLNFSKAMGSIKLPLHEKPVKRGSNHRASHKGYKKHKVNPTFRSRSRMNISPAQFRRMHLGRTSERWFKDTSNAN